MRFSEDIIKRILSELEKVPNVRYVCSKVGIDHSTFYRWMMKFPTLNKQMLASITIGKQSLCGTAEAVIIKGVQNGDFKASTFFLTHNDPDYMSKEKGMFFAERLQNKIGYASQKIKTDGSNFETLFTSLEKLAQIHDAKTCAKFQKMTIELLCDHDPDLIELYHKSYEYWKMQRMLTDAVNEAFDPDGKKKKEGSLTSPTSPSSIDTCNKFTQEAPWGQEEQKP